MLSTNLVMRSRDPHLTLPHLSIFHATSFVSPLQLIHRLKKLCQCVYVVDLPGHGRSAIPEGEPEASWLTDSVCEVLATLVKDRVLLFGNSLGA